MPAMCMLGSPSTVPLVTTMDWQRDSQSADTCFGGLTASDKVCLFERSVVCVSSSHATACMVRGKDLAWQGSLYVCADGRHVSHAQIQGIMQSGRICTMTSMQACCKKTSDMYMQAKARTPQLLVPKTSGKMPA